MTHCLMAEISIGSYAHAWKMPVVIFSVVSVYCLLRYFRGKFRIATSKEFVNPRILDTAEQNNVKTTPVSSGCIQKYKVIDREIPDVRIPSDSIPKSTKIIYNVGVLGVAASGKTALCLRLTNPLVNMENIAPTMKAQYERTISVSESETRRKRTEHVIRFLEWGGEFLVGAQSDIIMMSKGANWDGTQNNYRVMPGLQALIFVVDIAAFESETGVQGKNTFSIERIRQQVDQYFTRAAISFILNESIVSRLHTVILFVNKSDCFDGSQAELEEKVKSEYFGQLIQTLQHRFPDTRVIIGSALSGLGLNTLMAALALNILPKDALGSGGSPDEHAQEMLELVAGPSALASSTGNKGKA